MYKLTWLSIIGREAIEGWDYDIFDHFRLRQEKQGPKRYAITDWPSPSLGFLLSSVALLGFATGVSAACSAPVVPADVGGAVAAPDSRVAALVGGCGGGGAALLALRCGTFGSSGDAALSTVVVAATPAAVGRSSSIAPPWEVKRTSVEERTTSGSGLD